MRSGFRNITATACAITASLITGASSAFAHGAMASADDLGRPLAASAAIAFICYWAVVLWPSRKVQTPTQPAKRARRRNRAGMSGANNGPRADSLKMVGRARNA